MFNFSEWLKEKIISGVQNRIFAPEYAAILTANYRIKGMLDASQCEMVASVIDAVMLADGMQEAPVPETSETVTETEIESE